MEVLLLVDQGLAAFTVMGRLLLGEAVKTLHLRSLRVPWGLVARLLRNENEGGRPRWEWHHGWLRNMSVNLGHDEPGSHRHGCLAQGLGRDVVWDVPSELGVGKTIEGKKAAAEWFKRWEEEFHQEDGVQDLCMKGTALLMNNVINVEWTCTETDGRTGVRC